jgi:hypothetical protein
MRSIIFLRECTDEMLYLGENEITGYMVKNCFFTFY